MARYSRWHDRPFHHRHFHERWREPREPQDPGFQLPFPLPPLPPLPFNLESESEYPRGEEEAERHHHRRSHWAPYQGGEGEGEGDYGEEAHFRARRGRWVRHQGKIVLLDV